MHDTEDNNKWFHAVHGISTLNILCQAINYIRGPKTANVS